PSMPSLLFERILRVAKVKESQSDGKPNFRIRDYSKSLTSPTPPDYLRHGLDVSMYEIGGSAIHILSPKGRKTSPKVLFLHGGSYVINATRPHWRFLAGLVERSGCTVVAPDYPLAPEHSFADAYRMLTKLYRSLLDEVPSSGIILMGDSAGGGLALGLSMLVRDEKMPQPSAVVMLSPWLDVTMSNPYMEEIDPEDPFLNIEALRKAGFSWAHGANPRKPLISPIYGDLSGLPPLHLFTGTKDVLAADCRRIRGLCMAAGAKMAYYEFENMVHDWMLLDFKEAKMAAAQIAAIVAGEAGISGN
ncbi:MAG TPA: alpha/beta hydrolase, partial [Rectinemataceae bacterium]|nr:alpha/beta hydrolase [Rectinemataceae bacterium]